MAKGGSLLSAGGQRETRSQLGGLPIAEGDQDGKAMQPRAVQVAEGTSQRGVVVSCGERLQRARGVLRDVVGRRQRLPSVGPRGKPAA